MSIDYYSGDLFDSEGHYAHCVSRDLKMGAGIAKEFRRRFGDKIENNMNLDENLLSQNPRVGSVCTHLGHFYMITKERYFGKPTYKSMRSCLVELRNQLVEHDIECINMPRIGCGLDKLIWAKVESIINDVFKDTDIIINVYTL